MRSALDRMKEYPDFKFICSSACALSGYAVSNGGRIFNVTVKAKNGMYGFDFDDGAECCVENITVSGFDFGMRIDRNSSIIINDADLTGNRIAGITPKNENCDIIIMGYNLKIGEE